MLTDQLINDLVKKYELHHPIVCIPDGEDIRIVEALAFLRNVDVVLLGDVKKIEENLTNSTFSPTINIYPYKPQVIESLINKVIDLTKDYKKPFDYETLVQWSTDAPNFSMMLLKAGYVDCVVGGSSYPTSAILSPMLKLIKAKEPGHTISSYMLLEKEDETLVFSDCALNVKLNEQQMQDVMIDTYKSVKSLGLDPYMAILSYSSFGSGSGESVDFAKQAVMQFKHNHPKLSEHIIGEIQFDAAYDLEVRKIKSKTAGDKRVNTFIFPDLNSGNIGYKIAQYLGGYEAIGPIIQGSSLPVNDLSRGASSREIAKVIYLTIANI